MKITKIDTFLVNTGHRNWPIVKIHTDEGIYGIGEAYSCGPDKATIECIRDFEEWLIGKDPRNIEELWQLMYAGSRFPGGMILNAAISGIEHALWDIAGKAAGLPVYMLMGGKCRDKIRVYQAPYAPTPEEGADNAIELIEKYGYSAIKMCPLPPDWQAMPWNAALREADARVRVMREAVGPDIDIGLDPHARTFEPIRAIELAEVVAPYRPFFIEEPTRPENYDALRRVSEHVNVPIATGEMLYTRHEFRDLLKQNAVDIVQPDICVTGGIWEMKKIAAMAEASYASVAPHNPCGPIATAVNVHFALSTHNFLILEYHPDDDPDRSAIVDEPMRLQDGYLLPPTRPGLGLDLNLDALKARPAQSWHRRFLWRVDGSLGYQ